MTFHLKAEYLHDRNQNLTNEMMCLEGIWIKTQHKYFATGSKETVIHRSCDLGQVSVK